MDTREVTSNNHSFEQCLRDLGLQGDLSRPPDTVLWQHFLQRLRTALTDDDGVAARELALESAPQSSGRAALSSGVFAAAERDNLRAVLDALSDGLIQVDRELRVRYVNAAAERLLESSAETLHGERLFHLLSLSRSDDAKDGKYTVEELVRELNGGREIHCPDGVVETAAGKRLPAQFVLSAIESEALMSGALLVIRDLSKWKAQAEELVRARSDADVARRAQRTKAEFLANMSHEIRTPMNGVVGMLELLLDSELDPLQRDYTATAKDSAHALLALINDILDFSKIEAGKTELEMIDFRPGEHLESIAVLLADSAHKKGLELVVATDPAMPYGVVGDPSRLRQVLTNLVGNAVKFTEKGHVIVAAHVQHSGGRNAPLIVRYEVKDTGIGIGEASLPKLFDSFSQVDASTTRKYGGTGLGLAISHRLVALLGGELRVDTREGEGSTFYFSVPFKRSSLRPTKDTITSVNSLGRRLLVVDDCAPLRDQLEQRLTSWGLLVNTCSDARSALRLVDDAVAQRRPYDLLLIDARMPGLDGVDLVWAVRADPRLRYMRIILMTMFGDRYYPEQTRGARVTAFLTKPIRDEQLHDSVMNVLHGKKRRHSSAAWRKATTMMTVSNLATTEQMNVPHILVAATDDIERRALIGSLRRLGYRCSSANSTNAAVTRMLSRSFDGVIVDVTLLQRPGPGATLATANSWLFGATVQCKFVAALVADDAAFKRLARSRPNFDMVIAVPVDAETLHRKLASFVPIDQDAARVESDLRGAASRSPHVKLSAAHTEPALTTGLPAFTRVVPSTEPAVKATVLVAEDNLVNQTVTRALLRRLGYDCDIVENGQQVLDALLTKSYAAILMDCMMPVMDGYDATRAVRTLQGDVRRIPIIAMTANALAEDRAKAVAAGMDDYVSKPVSRKTLGRCLEHWLAKEAEHIAAGEREQAFETVQRPASLPIVDADALAELKNLGGDAAFVAEVVTMFLNDLDERLSTLQRAITATDSAAIKRVAHALKGACRYVGALSMAQTCRQLENAGDAADLDAAVILSRQLSADALETRQVFEQMGVSA